jgi:signal transduction histidine kinase
MRADLAETNEELRAAQSRLRSTAEAGERLRISRELHDLVGHQLSALALELEVAAHLADGDAASHVDRARRTAKDLLSDVRRAVGRLRATPGGVSAAVGTVTGIAKPEVHLDIDDDLDFDDPERANALVRCVQEIVTNTVRHAAADQLWITVARTGDEVTVRARDDGCGAASIRPGNGLTGMRERLEGLDGTLAYGNGADGGFTVTARLPAS